MLHKSKGIVLRSIKYGDTSLISTIFTDSFGVQAYIIQGVRSSKARNNRAGLLQAATLLDLVSDQIPKKNLQRIKEFQLAYLYTTLQEEVIKNSIALFCVELLLKLLPENAIMPEIFDFAFDYFVQLDKMPVEEVANFPLYFTIQCCNHLGYNIKGEYSEKSTHLNLWEGGFTEHAPAQKPYVSDEDARALAELLKINELTELKNVSMNAGMRNRLLDWFIEYLQQHTQHLGSIKSLAVIRTILH